ncbi:MAG: hormogonium polysaccharide biosynthesis protein HpsL [Oscillatoria sp. PMC 1051.18]|nr:hormogonium polysaccharide biosynthesis protein HpsL [Oscillatoria sp. PMC 1050.18]MEC5029291.1 hormogonium polysaccharide biosynthesis protein HpsL [Oscillatoria sp. PMC 1051.18]
MLKSKKKKKSQKGKKQSEQPPLSLKEQLAKKRQAQETRKKLISLVSGSLFFGIAVGLPLAFAVKPLIGAAIAAGIPCLVLSYVYPRQALWFFLIYLPFSGTVQYQIMGGNAIFSLAKDAFFIPAMLGLMQECKQKKQPFMVPKKLLTTLWLLLGFSLLTLFLVNLPLQFSGEAKGNPFPQGILGLKVLLGYVPLIFCAYYLIENKKQLLFLARLHLILAIICCLLGIVQYWMLDSGRCEGTRNATGVDLFTASIEAKCFVGGSLTFSPSENQIRLPGTLPSPWHWAWFLIPNSALTFTVAFCDPKNVWRITGLVGMALVFINAVISGQRIALALVPVVTVFLLILTGQITNLKRFLPIGIGLGILLFGVMVSNPTVVQERIDSFVTRWQASPPTKFIEEQFGWAIKEQEGIFGRGLGTATNSTRIFGKTVLVETFHPKILYEMGWFGLLGFLIFVTHLMVVAFQSRQSIKEKTLRSFASSYWVFLLIISYFPYWYPLDTDPVAVYYWFFAGVIYKLPEIDKQEQEAKLKAAQENPELETKAGKKNGRRSLSRSSRR